jgi:hypothetical protein
MQGSHRRRFGGRDQVGSACDTLVNDRSSVHEFARKRSITPAAARIFAALQLASVVRTACSTCRESPD